MCLFLGYPQKEDPGKLKVNLRLYIQAPSQPGDQILTSFDTREYSYIN